MKVLLAFVCWLNLKLSALSVRLVRWTGKSNYYLHPKHLLSHGETHYWYLDGLPKDGVVLDIGCDAGDHALQAAGEGCLVVGLDQSFERLRVAQKRTQTVPAAGATWAQANVESSLPLKAHSVDMVLFLDTLEHLQRREEVLKEVHRVLKCNGKLALSVPKIDTTWKRLLASKDLVPYSDPDHKVEYTRRSLEEEIERGGFRIAADLGPIVFDTPLSGVIDLTGGFSLSLYGKLMKWKRTKALQKPWDSTGFRVLCKKL